MFRSVRSYQSLHFHPLSFGCILRASKTCRVQVCKRQRIRDNLFPIPAKNQFVYFLKMGDGAARLGTTQLGTDLFKFSGLVEIPHKLCSFHWSTQRPLLPFWVLDWCRLMSCMPVKLPTSPWLWLASWSKSIRILTKDILDNYLQWQSFCSL